MLFLSFLCFALIYLARTYSISPSQLVEIILFSTYQPHFNICQASTIGNVNILGIYSFVLMLMMFIFMALERIKRRAHSISLIIRTITILGLSVLAIVQQLSRNAYFEKEKSVLIKKSISEKYTLLTGPAYNFAEQCRSSLPGKHQGSIISDQDLSHDPYSYLYRFLSYHLYPTISIRFQNNTPNDTLILFFKDNPLDSIPATHQPFVVESSGKYVLAIEKNHE